ncbi:MAG: low temperature requirement protein A [Actinomycetota bacterium]|nr:low temperature requirement protein A [Actinomycetota bacterium]
MNGSYVNDSSDSSYGSTGDSTGIAEAERHATNLELFLDLVFVFAITQIASLISHHPGPSGTAQGLLIAALVWWQWSQFTWAGSAIDLQRVTRTRVLVLCLIPVTLVMTISIPDAFHETGVWFGVAYFGVQVLVLAMQGMVALANPVTRPAFIRYGSFATAAPALVLAGAFVHGDVRSGLWVAAATLNVVGAIRGAGGEWVINPVHFAERHALFVIISLGEVLVAAGASASEIGLDARTALAIVVSVAVACTLWWTYFAFIPEVTERLLRGTVGPQRGRLARDVFTLGHFPIVFGLVLYAVVVKHLVPHPDGRLTVDDRWLLAISVALFLLGLLAIQYRAVRKVATERLVVVGAAAGLCALGGVLPGLVVVGAVAVLYGIMQAITWRRFTGGRPAAPTP